MSVQTPTGVVNGENADNFEDIEKQFAVKGEFVRSVEQMTCPNMLSLRSRPAHDHLLVDS
jgi:hypothetical protein